MSIGGRVGFALFAVFALASVSAAADRCGRLASDGAQVALVKERIADACPCTVGAGRTAYVKCANRVIANAVAAKDVRSQCRAALREGVAKSTCGRNAGATVCCSETVSGAPSCRIARTPSGCSGSARRIAWVGDGQSCDQACGGACGSAADCDDGNACTADACDLVLGCSNTPIPGCGSSPPPPPSASNCSGTASATWEMAADELQLLDLVNAERRRRGLQALGACRSLAKAAQKHSADMRDRDYFSHMGKGGSSFTDRICDAGYKACRTGTALGEVITADRRGPSGAFEDWMNSPSHRSVLLHSSLRVAGIGHACGGRYGGYWTIDFAGTNEASCN